MCTELRGVQDKVSIVCINLEETYNFASLKLITNPLVLIMEKGLARETNYWYVQAGIQH